MAERAAPQLVPLEPAAGTADLLYSVTMIDLSKVCNFYIACGYTGLRCGIERLAAVVAQ